MNRKYFAIAATVVAVVLVLAIAWSVAWWFAAREIREEAQEIRASIAKDGYDVYGEPVSVTGFPGPHEVRFSGGVRGFDFNLEIPMLVASGFFMPGQEVFLTLPAGARLAEPADPHDLMNIKAASVSFIIPDELPGEPTAPNMKAWQEGGNSLEITGFDIQRDDIWLTGEGVGQLDTNLQPEGRLAVRMTGHMKFLETLKQAGLIEDKQFMLFGAILAAASKPEPESGELVLETEILIQDQNLTIGPARVGSLPAIEWPRPAPDTRSPPAPPQ